ncbi:MauE/DoxX family redox-associated membrane protein [Variovorax sp. LG9.2]|uniref:MauE/DoxX family redox-associated membrane protein n=1 Tax=Variovorax sp. LG9.2 TaxID=3048626 RepID=UPI003A59994C
MVMEKHICPYGLKVKYLLEHESYVVEDRWLKTRKETDAFKAEQEVKTTPQTFIDGKRVGGHDETRRFLGKEVKHKDATSYTPVLAIFATAALMALAVSWALLGNVFTVRAAEWFIAFSMCILAVQKLQDIDSFATMFLGYDLLAQRWVPYAWIYPFGELLAGVLVIARALNWISVPVALLIGTIGAVSVFYAVYTQKRELKCACAGGNSNVPLGFVSLTENLMMIAMAVWMVFT